MTRLLRTAPCVTYTLRSNAPPRVDQSGRVVERVEITAHLPRGERITESFPYDWVYQNPKENDPFYHGEEYRSDFPVVPQRPPRGFTAPLPSLVAYALSQTDRQGVLHDRPCPVTPTPEPSGLSSRVDAGLIKLRNATGSALPVEVLPYFRGPAPPPIASKMEICASLRNRDARILTSFRMVVTFSDSSGTTLADEALQRDVMLHRGEADGPMSDDDFVARVRPKDCVPFETLAALRGKHGRVKQIDVRVTSLRFSDGSEVRQ